MTQIILSIPNDEVNFIMSLAKKMGWTFEKKDDVLTRFISSCPPNTNITDKEIQDAVNAIRYDQ